MAVLMVVLSHTSQHLGSGNFYFELSKLIAQAGDRGVELFFILSAFTLFSSSLARFQNDTHPTRNFYIRRAFRILPFWWLMVGFWALYYSPHFYQIVPSLLFAYGFLRFDGALEIVPGGWTLFVEETFYLLLPLLFGKIRSLWRALGLFAALWIVSDIWLTEVGKVGIFDSSQFAFFAPPSHWFAFGLGIVGYFLVRHELIQKHLIANRNAWLFLDALALGSAWFFLRADFRIQTFALFFVFLAAFADGSVIGKVMRNPLLMRFGRYCYSAYLLQFPLLLLLDPVRNWLFRGLHLTTAPYELQLLAYYPVVLAILLVLSFIAFNVVERPCIDLGKKLILHLTERGRRRAMAAEESPKAGMDEAAQF